MSVIKTGTTSTTGYIVESDTNGNLVIQTGSTPTTALTLNSNQTATFAQSVNIPNTFGFKNRIINGGMVIDQRNAGASVTPSATNTYLIDRWVTEFTQASKLTFQQNLNSVTPPSGFTNYLGVSVASTATVGASDYFLLETRVEGYNFADLAWGTANAQSATLSFWVRSSVTGTFGASFSNADASRTYPFTYAINAANTWEYKTVTVAGDTTGTWNTTNGRGLTIYLSLGTGSSFAGTAGAWVGASRFTATGATSIMGTLNATFYITGVQLERGSTATSFDYRPYGTELMLCQRYYEKSYDIGTVPGTVTANAMSLVWSGQSGSGTLYTTSVPMMVEKRANPTLTAYNYANGTVGQWHFGVMGASETAGTFTFTEINTKRIRGTMSPGTSGNNVCYGHWTASAEL